MRLVEAPIFLGMGKGLPKSHGTRACKARFWSQLQKPSFCLLFWPQNPPPAMDVGMHLVVVGWGVGGGRLSHVATCCILGNSTHRIWSLPIYYSHLLLCALCTFWLMPLWLPGELLQEAQWPAYPSWNTDGSGLFVYSSARLTLICQL